MAYIFLLLPRFVSTLGAQEMQPRAYLPTPVGVNFFGSSYSRNSGGLLFDPSLPVEDAHVDANIATFSFAQSLGVLGRSAQVLAIVPYVQADVTGRAGGVDQYRYRSGLGDSVFRYAMNIYDAPAMNLPQFAKYKQKTIVGASVTVSTPTGQYDPNVLVNIGTNRWGVKPELGISRALGKWVVEGAAAPGSSRRTTASMGIWSARRSQWAVSKHTLCARFRSGLWAAFDATYFTGGRSAINGQDRADYQGNSRLGVTLGVAISRRQAVKISYFNGVTTRIGSDIGSFGISYNIIWLKGR